MPSTPPTPAEIQAAERRLEQLRRFEAIGLDVWYHDPDWPEKFQPRPAKITAHGHKPGTVNLTVFCDKLLDVMGRNQPPIILRREVPFLEGYPAAGFPLFFFCVIPHAALAAERERLHELLGQVASYTEGGPDADPAAQADTPPPQGTAEPAKPPAPAAAVPSRSKAKPGAPAAKPPPAAAGAGGGKGQGAKPEPVTAKPKAPAPTPPPKDMQRGPINKLLAHPLWDRELQGFKGKTLQTEEGLDFTTVSGIFLARIDFVYDPSPRAGYRLKAHVKAKGSLGVVMDGCNNTNDVRRLGVLAARTAVLGQGALSTKDAAIALQKAKESLEEGLTLPPDDGGAEPVDPEARRRAAESRATEKVRMDKGLPPVRMK